jgi:hypothetical protein
MLQEGLKAALALWFFALPLGGAQAADDVSRYPDWRGQWGRVGSGDWDPTMPPGLGQHAPLTQEYAAMLEKGLADQARGGQGTDPGYQCRPHGMPRSMIGILPLEFIITPEVTYIQRADARPRRVYTDGRDWPQHMTPSLMGFSVGQWLDTQGSGRYDTLLIETRAFIGPRSFDGRGIPLHDDGATIVRERISLDRANRNTMHNEITTIDHALTRPWTVTRTYSRIPEPQAVWADYVCAENNRHVVIQNEDYIINQADGNLMPVRKDQPAPDLRNFSTQR